MAVHLDSPLTEFAPAKINLSLEVLGKRTDGYHEIASLVAFADAGDVLTLRPGEEARVTTSGPFGQSIAGANLVETALHLVARAEARLRLGAVHLEKNLPVAAGIGGGSADAAAVLRLLRRANPELAGGIDWHRLAMQLGADVPVCLQSRLSWMTGIGEKVEPILLNSPFALHAIIANPLVGVPPDKTAQVFRAARAPPLAADFRAPPFAHAQAGGIALVDFVASSRNTLQRAASDVVPAIAEVLKDLKQLPGSRLARMSGGGPTCFAIFDTAAAAESARVILAEARPQWWVVAATLG